jgi:kynurenine formamidase
MIADITHLGNRYRVDLSKPIDLSIPLHDGKEQLRAWGVDPVTMEPVEYNGQRYTVKDGAPVNFRTIRFNPHGHGTHTESVGHISPEAHPVGALLPRYFFLARLVSLLPEQRRAPDDRSDLMITLEQLRGALDGTPPEALVIRTLPHASDLDRKDWSNSNPCYVQSTACAWLRSIGVQHLLIDLPSVDREEDGGLLAAHHAFWGYPGTIDLKRTITELLHVPERIPDGHYLLELQVAHFVNDAAPSRPVLYALLP